MVYLGMDNNNFSQVLEMCSRAQYKLILVTIRDNSLHDEIISTRAEITVVNIEDVDTLDSSSQTSAACAVSTVESTCNIVLIKMLQREI